MQDKDNQSNNEEKLAEQQIPNTIIIQNKNEEAKESQKNKNDATNSEKTRFLKRVPQLKTEMKLRSTIAYDKAISVLKMERKQNKDLQISNQINALGKKEEPQFVKRTVNYSNVYDGEIFEGPKMSKEEHAENLKRIREYNRDQSQRSKGDRAVTQTLENLDKHPEIGKIIGHKKEQKEKMRDTLKEKNTVRNKSAERGRAVDGEEIKENKEIKSIVKDKQKSKSSKRKSLRKSGSRNKIKDENSYSKSELLKNRKKILAKMPLFEALYRRATGNPKPPPEVEILKPTPKINHRPNAYRNKSSTRLSRNIPIDEDKHKARTSINLAKQKAIIKQKSVAEIKTKIVRAQFMSKPKNSGVLLKKLFMISNDINKDSPLKMQNSEGTIVIPQEKSNQTSRQRSITMMLLDRKAKDLQIERENKSLQDILRTKYFQCYGNPTQENQSADKPMLKSKAQQAYNPPLFTSSALGGFKNAINKPKPEFPLIKDGSIQLMVEGDSIISHKERERSKGTIDATYSNKESKRLNLTENKINGSRSLSSRNKDLIFSTFAQAASREIRIKPALNKFTKSKSHRYLNAHIKRLTKKKDIKIDNKGVFNYDPQEDLNYVDKGQRKSLSKYPKKLLSRDAKSQATLRRYNLARSQETESTNRMEDIIARVNESKIPVDKFFEKKNVSFMKMLSRLDTNFDQNPSSLQEIVIQKRRLIANQEKRFKGVKVKNISQEKELKKSKYIVIKSKIATDIEKYKRNLTKRDMKEDTNSEYGASDVNQDETFFHNKNSILADNELNNKSDCENSSKSLKDLKIDNDKTFNEEHFQEVTEHLNSRFSIKIGHSKMVKEVYQNKFEDKVNENENCASNSHDSNHKHSNSAKSFSVLSAKYNSWNKPQKKKRHIEPTMTSVNFNKKDQPLKTQHSPTSKSSQKAPIKLIPKPENPSRSTLETMLKKSHRKLVPTSISERRKAGVRSAMQIRRDRKQKLKRRNSERNLL
ncbi:unnamed protein product [Moneuplotes crassus]|uniref:Uncharacterized protein n=1 Tax=Euplotes crassus TaxID=5936 RepID=A0AAD1XMP4_EUPCR|nr:unnamed protein product [Moneuplotes crassus]